MSRPLSLARRLMFFSALSIPAFADAQFQVRKMTRSDVPFGKGQCDIRLQVDGEAEISVRGDTVSIRTISGRDARDDGSECNEPLPTRALLGFYYEARGARGDMRLVGEPSPQTSYRAVVRIRDSQGGEGGYQFRLAWDAAATSAARPDAFGGNRRVPPSDDWRGGRANSRQAGVDGTVQATAACLDGVRARLENERRVSDLAFRNVRAAGSLGDETVTGDVLARRGNQTYSFACRVNFDSGRVLSVDLLNR